ncbi:helix-turn-helix domain-containing protein [Sphingomonas sp. VDB2]|uniref:helix-turn-helix domain-containing protein n=1 Tax=Sphingomonas sp. VDB2 TaxID=3228751 RepID=UPI003A81019A
MLIPVCIFALTLYSHVHINIDMNAIRQARHRLGLTQIGLAEKLGLHQSTISRFENGTLPIDERTSLAIEALLSRPIQQEAA